MSATIRTMPLTRLHFVLAGLGEHGSDGYAELGVGARERAQDVVSRDDSQDAPVVDDDQSRHVPVNELTGDIVHGCVGGDDERWSTAYLADRRGVVAAVRLHDASPQPVARVRRLLEQIMLAEHANQLSGIIDHGSAAEVGLVQRLRRSTQWHVQAERQWIGRHDVRRSQAN